jgi:hypothetical protein
MLLFVLHSRALDRQRWKAAIDRLIVGGGSMGPPSDHALSFQRWQAKVSVPVTFCWD